MFIFLVVIIVLTVAGVLIFRNISDDNEAVVSPDIQKMQALGSTAGFNAAVLWSGLPGQYGLAIDPSSEQFALAIPDVRLGFTITAS